MTRTLPTSCIAPHPRTYKVQPADANTDNSPLRLTLDAWHANCLSVIAASGGPSFQPPSSQSM